jgi:hypothetical protein
MVASERAKGAISSPGARNSNYAKATKRKTMEKTMGKRWENAGRLYGKIWHMMELGKCCYIWTLSDAQ